MFQTFCEILSGSQTNRFWPGSYLGGRNPLLMQASRKSNMKFTLLTLVSLWMNFISNCKNRNNDPRAAMDSIFSYENYASSVIVICRPETRERRETGHGLYGQQPCTICACQDPHGLVVVPGLGLRIWSYTVEICGGCQTGQEKKQTLRQLHLSLTHSDWGQKCLNTMHFYKASNSASEKIGWYHCEEVSRLRWLTTVALRVSMHQHA